MIFVLLSCDNSDYGVAIDLRRTVTLHVDSDGYKDEEINAKIGDATLLFGI